MTFYSENTSDWQPAGSIPGHCRSMIHGIGNNFACVGGGNSNEEVFWYLDNYWEGTFTLTGTGVGSHFAFGADGFFIVGHGNAIGRRIDTTRTSWNPAGTGFLVTGGHHPFSVIAYGGEDIGFAVLNTAGNAVITSPTGTAWTATTLTGTPGGMIDMVYANGRFVAVGAAGKSVTSTNGTTWTEMIGLNPYDDFIAVDYGDGRFMALGRLGSVYTSTNGTSWTVRNDGSTMTYRAIASGGGKFVAVGDQGAAVSTDGRSWQLKTETGMTGLTSVTYGAGAFIAVGGSGIIFKSTDGDTWTRVGNNIAAPGDSLMSVAFGVLGIENTFVAVGRNGQSELTALRIIRVSTDAGENWSDFSGAWAGGEFPNTISFGNGQFVINCRQQAGRVRTSVAPRTTWTTQQIEGASWIESIVYSGEVFTAFDGTSAFTSTTANDGSWTAISGGQLPASTKKVIAAKGYYIAVASGSGVMASMPMSGGTWSNLPRATNRELNTIYFDGNDVLLAAGVDGAMLYSTENPVSIRHNITRTSRSTSTYNMRLETGRGAPVISLSFAPERAGTIAVYSLTGRQLYRTNVGANQRSIQLPRRAIPSGSVIVRYIGGDGITVSQRFQVVR
jgi:hypothetical protein